MIKTISIFCFMEIEMREVMVAVVVAVVGNRKRK